jgi:bifunctional non-homologous end joining protein LigD
VYEEKYDGWRMVAYKHGQQVRLLSRNRRDHTERFAELAAAIAALPAHTLILDGEVSVFDEDLVSQFHLPAPRAGVTRRMVCYLFVPAVLPFVSSRGG